MLWPLIEFGSGAFLLLLAVFCIAELFAFFNGEESLAIGLAVIFAVAVGVIVDDFPSLTWHYLAVYLAGAFVWVPIYWYLTLRRNRRHLLRLDPEILHPLASTPKQYGTLRDGKWLPKHPDKDALTANGLMWPLAAPVYMGHDWINWIIDLFQGLMNKVQQSLAVDANSSE